MSNLISLFDELPSEPVSCSPTLIIFSLAILQGKVVDITSQEGNFSWQICNEKYHSRREEETRHLTADKRWREKSVKYIKGI